MDCSNFSANYFEEILVTDELHVVALDNLLLYHDDPNKVTLQGIAKTDSRWHIIDGEHSVFYDNDNRMQIDRTTEKDSVSYLVRSKGRACIKSIYQILNAKRMQIENETFISPIDNYIMKELDLLDNGNFVYDIVPKPIDGIYTLFNGDDYMVAHREQNDKETKYTIDFSGGHYFDQVKQILDGDANRIRVVNCSILGGGMNVRLKNKPPLHTIHPSQQLIVDWTVNQYVESQDKNVTILVSGEPGLGKSTLAFLISQRFKQDLGVDPYLIKGFNINSEEMQYHPIMNHYNPSNNCPIILLLDEIDIALQRANASTINVDPSKPMMQQSHAISGNKTNMNNFLDSINDESFLITVVTTNVPIEEMQEQYGVYIRQGRFHMHFQMVSEDEVVPMEPN